MDAAQVYAQGRARIIALAQRIGPERLSQPVAATPGWSGLDVLAHLVSVPADVLSGRLDGAGTPEWTARQVAERRGSGVDALVNDWQATAASFDPLMEAASGLTSALAADVVHHELDLRGMLGEPPDESLTEAVDFGLNFMLGSLDGRLRQRGLPALHARAANQEWTLGEGEPAATVTTTPLELFRIVAGRRSPAQVANLDWEGDPTPYLDALSAFGPLRSEDLAL